MNSTQVHTLRIFTIALLLAPWARSGAAEDKPAEAFAQYAGWQHSGSLYIMTTPEGAHLPATASEDGFPLLVRLDKDWFDFSQAQAHGEDIRFAVSTGTPLAYEVDAWDAVKGTASIWVRMPTIKGNARQELKMFWGKTDAQSESQGSAVFNDSNGYLSVWHMHDPVTDEVGTLEQIALLEGQSTVVTAKADGAQKVYWLIRRGGRESVAAVDRFAFTLDAGRVTGDESLTLQFKAVYADTVKTLDIPVTIKEDIPEPVLTLSAPATWDGRETIEVESHIVNMQALQAKGAGALKYHWTASGLAVIKEIGPGTLILTHAQNSGKLAVTAAVNNGGEPTTQTLEIAVHEPGKDAWLPRIPDPEEKPVDNQFFARDDKNEGTLYFNGTLSNAADSVFLQVYADGKLIKTESQKLQSNKTYAFTVKLTPGLVKYKVVFGSKRGNTETVLHTAANLVCGDAYLIDGQSNAVATDWGPDEFDYSSDWIRSFGSMGNKPTLKKVTRAWVIAIAAATAIAGNAPAMEE